MRYALKIAYDGQYFHGFARQPYIETVEGTLIQTCINNGIFEDTKTALFQSSSRTDKGVSSFGTVVAFNTENKIQDNFFELNNDMDHIVIYGISTVEFGFYPRYAKNRIYRYYLKKDGLDIDSLSLTAHLFIGTFDYSNFAKIEIGKNPIRTIDKITITQTKKFFIIDFHAQTYLWHQIRRIISAIIQVEQGKITRDDINDALKDSNKRVDLGLAPAKYLILTDVEYDFSFSIDVESKKKRDELEQSLINSF